MTEPPAAKTLAVAYDDPSAVTAASPLRLVSALGASPAQASVA